MKTIRYYLLAALLLAMGCHPTKTTADLRKDGKFARFVLKEALMECFPEGTAFDDGSVYNCEFSAVAAWEDGFIFGNDKNTSAVSPVFTSDGAALKAGRSKATRNVVKQAFRDIRKIEDFAFSPDGEYLFITSGFDRILNKEASWDNYNHLLAWDIKKDKLQLLLPSKRDGVESSKDIRYALLEMLASKHMKIEGLMILPGNRLVLGVREMGEHFERPTYTSTLVETTYEIKDGEVTLSPDFKITLQVDTDTARKGLGLSSLFYDKEKQRIYMTTSYEAGEEGRQELGGYIWSISLEDYDNRRPNALLLQGEDGKVFRLRHKVEGITKMKDGNYFIIYDNDRSSIPVELPNGTTVERKPHQAVYSIVELP